MVCKTACHHFLPKTGLIVSAAGMSGPVSAGRRPRVIRFLRPSGARPTAASGRDVDQADGEIRIR
jgi:hypothetical protein